MLPVYGATNNFDFNGNTYFTKNYDRVATDLYVDKPLTDVSIKYSNQEYIADMVLPRIPVMQETGIIWSYGMENFNLKDLQRGDKSVSKRSGYTVSSSTTYRITNYALSDIVTAGMRAQADSPMSPDVDTTEYLTEILALNKEYLAASALFNTGTSGFSGYTEALNSGSARYQWNDYTNSNPIQDISYAKRTKIAANSGATNNIWVVMGEDVMTYLENHPDLLDNIKYTQTGIITEDLVAKLFQVEKVVVGKSMYNASNEGQTASLSRVWGKYVLVMNRPARPALKTSATAVMVHGGNYARKWTEPSLRGADVIEVEEALQVKVLSPKSGYLFSTAVA